ncbi:TetR family transcriptional regulator [Streptomyces sp. NPDC004230]
MRRTPVQQRSTVTRGKILDAASRIIAEQGYATTTIQDILDRAEVTKGSLYHFFKTKQDVAAAVVEMAAPTEFAPPGLPTLQSIVDESICLAVLTNRVPVIKAAFRLGTDQDHPFFGSLMDPYVVHVEELLTQSRELGELRHGVDIAQTSRRWVASFTGTYLMFSRKLHELPQEMAVLNASTVLEIATARTFSQLDVSEERGYKLAELSPWAKDYLSTAPAPQRSAGAQSPTSAGETDD